MRFDDRLRTVLEQPASDSHDRAVRWRQLVELVARSQGEADPRLVEEAVAAIRTGASAVDERVRSTAAAAIAPLPLPFALVAAFAADRLNVAAPILASARLTASEWNSVSQQASDDCRAFIAAIHSPQPDRPPAPKPEPRSAPPSAQQSPDSGEAGTIPSISDVLARIERLRQLRESGQLAAADTPQADEPSRLFKWECNESGDIDWVDGVPRGALVGQSIANRGIGSGVDPAVERAFAARAPFREGVLELPVGGATGGTWRLSGVPAFERASGRFAGYRGVAERASAVPPGAAHLSPDSLRELAHEIRTPLNAIIGFAEIIIGEYMGPADSQYRERAGEILSQARLLLDAVEDLDFAARLRSGTGSAQSELSDCLARSWGEIERQADAREIRIGVEGGEEPAPCALDPALAQRLVERLCVAVIGSAEAGESLTIRIASGPERSILAISRPASLWGIDLAPERNRRAADSATLPLRLVMGLARTAGGELSDEGDEILLSLPKA